MPRYLVTSALPYANGPIHFGHVAGAYLPADVYVRYLRARGEEVLYVCGTDEHGVAITLKAEQEGVSYAEYVARWHREIKAYFDRFGIGFDIFTGTSRCPYHAAASQRFFEVLRQRGYVNERVEEQWYSEAQQRFLPDRYLQGTCPNCGYEQARGDECPRCGAWIDTRKLGNPVSLVDGSRPVLRPTRHWYLDLPGLLQAGLLDWYDGRDPAHPHRPWKANVVGQVRSMLADLRERPITRDLPWGIPVPLPGADGKVLYVWFDAPIGYLSATMEWCAAQGEPEQWRRWWQDPETRLVHFMGKDNIAFHVLVFPAMLLGQGDAWEGKSFILPWAVPADEFYNLQGRKFSTSGGWYLDTERFFARFHRDAARFYLLWSGPENADTEFTWEGFQSVTNSLLADKLGNFASRVLKFCERRYANRVPAAGGSLDRHPLLEAADRSWHELGGHLDRHEFVAACKALIGGCDALNQFFDALAPWKLAKSSAPAERARCGDALERCLAYLELLSRRFAPFCPGAAATLRGMLGAAAVAPALSWGPEAPGHPPARMPAGAALGAAGVLFQKIPDEVVQEEKERLRQTAAAVGA
ncbi:MAG: methionine--tRNA ligase [Planctomycetota bacterium]|nr:MAG: methionine--tRNA ligase [Planctomycetota bacterium]